MRVVLRRRLRRAAVTPLAVLLLVATAGGGASQAAGAASSPEGPPYAVPAAGTYYPTAVHRLLGSAEGSPVVPGRDVTVPVVGHGDLPSAGISAALVNVTATAATTAATLGATASGSPSSSVPMVSVPAGSSVSTLLTVPLGPGGSFDLRAGGAPTTVTADLVGFYAADDTIVASRGLSGGYQPAQPERLYDTRSATAPSFFGLSSPRSGPIPGKGQTLLRADLGQAVGSHVTALALRVSATSSGPGTLTVWRAGQPADLASVSYAPGRWATNLAVVPVVAGPDGSLDIALSNAGAAPADVTVDLIGFYDDGGLGPNLRFRPLTPARVVDSVAGLGTSALSAGGEATLLAPSSVAGPSTVALVGVLTAVSPVSTTDLTLWPHGADRPSKPDVSAVPGQSTSVPVQLEIGPGNALDLAASAGPAQLVFDVTGSFEAFPPVADPAMKRWVHALPSWQVSATAR